LGLTLQVKTEADFFSIGGEHVTANNFLPMKCEQFKKGKMLVNKNPPSSLLMAKPSTVCFNNIRSALDTASYRPFFPIKPAAEGFHLPHKVPSNYLRKFLQVLYVLQAWFLVALAKERKLCVYV
jgi:hypothetical protein